jgi:nucleotide-binding universal stress UspA family protein
MIPKTLMLCVGEVAEAQAYKLAVGALARRLQCRVLIYHASRPQLPAEITGGAAEPASPKIAEGAALDALIGDPAFLNVEVSTHLVETPFDIVTDILDVAAARRADWVVMPSHARTGVDRLRFGSMSERMIRSCRIPVLTFDMARMRDQTDAAFDRILVPADFSAESQAALAFARDLAGHFKCGVTLVHAVEDYYTNAYPLTDVPFVIDFQPKLMAAAQQHLRRMAGASADAEVDVAAVPGTVVGVMHELVEKHRHPLVVMATAGRDSVGDWILGSRAERMLRSLHCSVLALPRVFLGVEKS